MFGKSSKGSKSSSKSVASTESKSGSKKNTIKFALKTHSVAREAVLVGSFSQWTPQVMTKQKDGSFATSLSLAAGTYEYKFIVDGQWMTDPQNQTQVCNEFGTSNSVVVVK